MTEPKPQPIEPLRLAAEPSALAGGRGELVLLPPCPDPAPAPRHFDPVDPESAEADRVLAESRRYRLAVARQARRRRRDGAEGGTP